MFEIIGVIIFYIIISSFLFAIGMIWQYFKEWFNRPVDK